MLGELSWLLDHHMTRDKQAEMEIKSVVARIHFHPDLCWPASRPQDAISTVAVACVLVQQLNSLAATKENATASRRIGLVDLLDFFWLDWATFVEMIFVQDREERGMVGWMRLVFVRDLVNPAHHRVHHAKPTQFPMNKPFTTTRSHQFTNSPSPPQTAKNPTV